MKSSIISLCLLANLLFVACKKTRTCSCTSSTTTTNITTPRGGVAPITTNVSTSKNQSDATYAKVRKNEMIRIMNCNSNTETSQNTYTTSGVYTSVTTSVINIPPLPPITFTVPTTITYTADVSSTNVTENTCEIK